MCSASISSEESSLSEWEAALDRAEEAMRRISGQCRLQKTGHPDVFCSSLPTHWRSNKSLPSPFVVLAFCPVPDGTRVCVSAGNDENFCADVKNNLAEFNGQLARFSDLRFVGKSGRGKNFNLSITIFTQPHAQMAVVQNVVKVTVDGPRDSRNASKYLNGQFIPIPKRIRSSSGLDQLTAQMTARSKNASSTRQCSSDSSSSSKMHHPSAATSFLLGPSAPSNGLPPPLPPFFPPGLPMAATLSGLFPRLVNGQLINKLGTLNPALLHQAALNFRPMLNMANAISGMRMPMPNSPMDSAMAQMAPLHAPQMGSLFPTSLPIGQALRHPIFLPVSSPLNLHAAISAAAAAAVSNASSNLPTISNPSHFLTSQAMTELFMNSSSTVAGQKFGEANGGGGRGIGEVEEEDEGTSRTSTDEGHVTEELREEETLQKDREKSSSADPPEGTAQSVKSEEKQSMRRKRNSWRRKEEEGGEGEEGDGGLNSLEGKMAGKRRRLALDGSEALAPLPKTSPPQQHGLWRPFHA